MVKRGQEKTFPTPKKKSTSSPDATLPTLQAHMVRNMVFITTTNLKLKIFSRLQFNLIGLGRFHLKLSRSFNLVKHDKCM